MPTTDNKKLKVLILIISMSLFFVHFPSCWYACFIYMFLHANIFHLAVNLYALWMIRLDKNRVISSYIISVFAYLLFPNAIGLSGMILAIVGMYANKKTWLYFAGFSIVTVFIPGIAFGVHTVCFISGYLYNKVRALVNDYRAAYTGR